MRQGLPSGAPPHALEHRPLLRGSHEPLDGEREVGIHDGERVGEDLDGVRRELGALTKRHTTVPGVFPLHVHADDGSSAREVRDPFGGGDLFLRDADECDGAFAGGEIASLPRERLREGDVLETRVSIRLSARGGGVVAVDGCADHAAAARAVDHGTHRGRRVAGEGGSTATRRGASALPVLFRRLPAFFARLAHTDAIASRACSKESSRLAGGTSSISPAEDATARGGGATSRPTRDDGANRASGEGPSALSDRRARRRGAVDGRADALAWTDIIVSGTRTRSRGVVLARARGRSDVYPQDGFG